MEGDPGAQKCKATGETNTELILSISLGFQTTSRSTFQYIQFNLFQVSLKLQDDGVKFSVWDLV